MFERFHVFTKAELTARAEVKMEGYAKTVNIEARTMLDMAGKQIMPVVIRYTSRLADSINWVRQACPTADVSVQQELLQHASAALVDMRDAMEELRKRTEEAYAMEDIMARARFCHDQVVPAMEALRAPADRLEMMVDKELWPFPSYGDLIFEV